MSKRGELVNDSDESRIFIEDEETRPLKVQVNNETLLEPSTNNANVLFMNEMNDLEKVTSDSGYLLVGMSHGQDSGQWWWV